MKNKCKFSRTCSKVGTEQCNKFCYPFTFMHGESGDTGMWKTRNVPKKYEHCLIENLPIEKDNPKTYKVIKAYINQVVEYVVDKGAGLFFFSKPTSTNKFGTGTGKTTTAIIILNEFVIARSKQHLKGEIKLKHNPALFVKASEFQNIYNTQFRGNIEMQQEASLKYYNYKERMKQVELLVLDDIAIRTATEAFLNELYELIDSRATEEKATIFISNIPIEMLSDLFGERIASRIEGMTVKIAFTGKDHRKGGIL